MKKFIIPVILTALLILVFTAPASNSVAYAASLSDNSVIVMSGANDGDKIEIAANLVTNSGTTAMVLEIVYDTDAMTLVDVKKGDALSSLDYTTTNANTDKGYSITPFKILYTPNVEAVNDYSTGILFKMVFELKNKAQNGRHNVSLKAEPNSVIYVDNGVDKAKNVLIDGVAVSVRNNSVTEINAINGEFDDVKQNTGTIVAVSVSSVVVIAAVVVIILFVTKKRKNNWTKL